MASADTNLCQYQHRQKPQLGFSLQAPAKQATTNDTGKSKSISNVENEKQREELEGEIDNRYLVGFPETEIGVQQLRSWLRVLPSSFNSSSHRPRLSLASSNLLEAPPRRGGERR